MDGQTEELSSIHSFLALSRAQFSFVFPLYFPFSSCFDYLQKISRRRGRRRRRRRRRRRPLSIPTPNRRQW